MNVVTLQLQHTLGSVKEAPVHVLDHIGVGRQVDLGQEHRDIQPAGDTQQQTHTHTGQSTRFVTRSCSCCHPVYYKTWADLVRKPSPHMQLSRHGHMLAGPPTSATPSCPPSCLQADKRPSLWGPNNRLLLLLPLTGMHPLPRPTR